MQESIAVTQNYVSSVNLPHVLKFLATQSEDLISGCPLADRSTLHRRFMTALEEHRPEVYPLPFPLRSLSYSLATVAYLSWPTDARSLHQRGRLP